MKIKKNGEVINLTESDLKRIVKNSLLKEETVEWDLDKERLEKDEKDILSIDKRLSLLEKEVHGNMDGEKFTDQSLQEQVDWLSSGMDEIGKTVTRILKHIKL
jgi:hypothetical protein